MSDEDFSILRSAMPLAEKLERARTELLDLSARNRLLNIPKSKTAKHVEIVDEVSEHIYRLLVIENKTLTFVPGRISKSDAAEIDDMDEDEISIAQLAQPSDGDDLDAAGNRTRHVDTKLQTRLTAKGLQKRLLDLYHDSRTLEEEQGVNILFLALGTLKWIDPNNKDNARFAPLVLVPVLLERGTAGEKFRLKARPEEQTANLSLEAYLDRVHKLKLPTFESGDDFDIADYTRQVAEAVTTKPDWVVNPHDITLGFFSFAKFLMYRDLDPENWPTGAKLTEQPIVRALLGEGFQATGELLPDDTAIDAHIPPEQMLHIVDSDSSQALAVHDVRQGRSLVIQGPPGTGKSQTIANVIASAVADGKTVLFVAEKMAALDVVKRRLDHAGVGDACLELHSNKANKRALLDELRRTWELGSPRGEFPNGLLPSLNAARDSLNAHAGRLHTAHGPSRLTPYQILGSLVRLRAEGQRPTDITLERAQLWTEEDLKKRLAMLDDLLRRIEDIGLPTQHPWRGVGLEAILPTELDRLLPTLDALLAEAIELTRQVTALAALFEQSPPRYLVSDVAELVLFAEMVASSPDLGSDALASEVWNHDVASIQALLTTGGMLEQGLAEAETWLSPGAIDVSIEALLEEFNRLPEDIPASSFGDAKVLKTLLPKVQAEASRLGRELSAKADLTSLASVIRLVATGERVAAAPNASPDAFAATVWEHGVEQAAELAEAVSIVEASRASVGPRILDRAWETDLGAARQTLASQTGVLRFLSGEWRNAKALAVSMVKDPAMKVPELISLLDELAVGQAALTKVRAGESFGRSAFGADWKGERSSATPLIALVEWMRTLRGLGAEPRVLASQLADRSGVKVRTEQLRKLVDQAKPHLSALWMDFGDKASELFDHEVSAERVSLAAWIQRAEAMTIADDLIGKMLTVRPDSHRTSMSHAQRLHELQVLAKTIDDHSGLGVQAFGVAYDGRRSNWTQLSSAFQWVVAHPVHRRFAARLPERKAVAERAKKTQLETASLQEKLATLALALRADSADLFEARNSGDFALATVRKTLESWVLNAEQLSKWVAYRHQARKASDAGMAQLVDRLASGELTLQNALSTLEMAYYEGLLKEVTETTPEIARFDGALHSSEVARFVAMDLLRIKAASLEVAHAHHRRIPPKEGGAGPVGILRGEMAKRRGHMPIRQLMQRAGPAVQAIKPVMMMSPLSVAQFLVPGRQTFDLLVMDEASQIQPVDAIGAVARVKQVVVVGDERQLPPTKFFSKMTGADPDEDEETTQVADIESILGLFVARGLPQRMLRWHYRSRHQSLIAVSNSQFYENKLFIVPSPYTSEAGMGLQFRFVPGGMFDSGGTGTNTIEAKAVARAILTHANTHPEMSLGVATFSVAQRRAIQDELELLRRLNPDSEGFFVAHPSEPFFVKNLENVQGDERDVIMISVGYAKNTQGYMAMRFGPLGADGGERRLNVLISRAKRRCEVFSSITDEDIDLERAKGKGVFSFKLFLHYARTGRLSMTQTTSKPLDSVFEEQVASALQNAGYQVHPQVGIAGFFIDLAIADPTKPGRYLIGIECDGASYHSARSARDRDRLRQAVLEDHGWIIHRIWSTDWFQRPKEQLDRTIAAIEDAKRALEDRLEAGLKSTRAVPVEIVTVDRGSVTEIGFVDASTVAGQVNMYIESSPARHTGYELHETPIGFMSNLVAEVVDAESPLHFDELVVRLRNAWGLQRAGARIEAAVARAVEVSQEKGTIVRSGAFLKHPTREPFLRDRQTVQSPGLRKPEMISPEEISAGVVHVVRVNLGATEDEVAMAVARALGFKSTSVLLKSLMKEVVEQLINCGSLRRDHSMLVIGNPS